MNLEDMREDIVEIPPTKEETDTDVCALVIHDKRRVHIDMGDFPFRPDPEFDSRSVDDKLVVVVDDQGRAEYQRIRNPLEEMLGLMCMSANRKIVGGHMGGVRD